MSMLFLYSTISLIVTIITGVVVVYREQSVLTGEDYALVITASIISGAFWPITVLIAPILLLFKGVNKYKLSVIRKKKEAEKEKKRLEFEEKCDLFFSKYQSDYTMLMFDRKMHESSGWTKENYKEYCDKVDSLVKTMLKDSLSDQGIRSEIVEYMDQFKPILF